MAYLANRKFLIILGDESPFGNLPNKKSILITAAAAIDHT